MLLRAIGISSVVVSHHRHRYRYRFVIGISSVSHRSRIDSSSVSCWHFNGISSVSHRHIIGSSGVGISSVSLSHRYLIRISPLPYHIGIGICISSVFHPFRYLIAIDIGIGMSSVSHRDRWDRCLGCWLRGAWCLVPDAWCWCPKLADSVCCWNMFRQL